MLTIKDLSHYERPARIYCAKLQINPDDVVSQALPTVKAPGVVTVRWMVVAEQMIHLSLMMVAMREVAGPQIIMPH